MSPAADVPTDALDALARLARVSFYEFVASGERRRAEVLRLIRRNAALWQCKSREL